MLIKDGRASRSTAALARTNPAAFDAYGEGISHADF